MVEPAAHTIEAGNDRTDEGCAGTGNQQKLRMNPEFVLDHQRGRIPRWIVGKNEGPERFQLRSVGRRKGADNHPRGSVVGSKRALFVLPVATHVGHLIDESTICCLSRPEGTYSALRTAHTMIGRSPLWSTNRFDGNKDKSISVRGSTSLK